MRIFGPQHVRRQVLQILDSFEMRYTAGVPVNTALGSERRSAPNGYIRARVSDTLIRLNEVQTRTDASAQRECLAKQARHIVRSGDTAGSLTDVLQRFSALERAR